MHAKIDKEDMQDYVVFKGQNLPNSGSTLFFFVSESSVRDKNYQFRSYSCGGEIKSELHDAFGEVGDLILHHHCC